MLMMSGLRMGSTFCFQTSVTRRSKMSNLTLSKVTSDSMMNSSERITALMCACMLIRCTVSSWRFHLD